ncbi:transposase [Candidatus Cloacimonadota bacterium]
MHYTLYYKRKLPHYQPRDATFFITLRLDFNIPQQYLLALNRYRETLQINYADSEEHAQTKEIIKKKSFAYEDELYHKCTGEIDVSRNPCANILKTKLLAMQDEFFYLYAFTIMHNHLHILLKPLVREGEQVSLSTIIKSFKGSTARLINMELKRERSLWYREYFDHWVRNQQELVNVIEYIRNNPVKAGLVKDAREWKETWLNPDLWQEQ